MPSCTLTGYVLLDEIDDYDDDDESGFDDFVSICVHRMPLRHPRYSRSTVTIRRFMLGCFVFRVPS